MLTSKGIILGSATIANKLRRSLGNLPNITGWVGVCHGDIIRPFFFANWSRLILQDFEHIHVYALQAKFDEATISRTAIDTQPPGTRDLTPVDYLLQNYLTSMVNTTRPHTGDRPSKAAFVKLRSIYCTKLSMIYTTLKWTLKCVRICDI